MIAVDEIKELFAFSEPGGVYRIESFDKKYPAWVVRFEDGTFGVTVLYDGPEINEEFANAQLYSGEFIIGDNRNKCLMLMSSVEKSRNEFALFCDAFAEPGNDGQDRKILCNDPSDWWRKWKFLIGNSIMDKRPYAIIGEMAVYEYLLARGEVAKWGGPDSASHDVVSEKADYEVKSTLSRYDKIVHISGQFQLQKSDKILFMYFVRFEQNINGKNINDYVERLVEKGVYRDDIEKKLGKQGYTKGNSAREENYIIHEVVEYEVNESFPRIIPQMFIGGALPKGIEQLSYDLDLSVVNGLNIEF